MTKYKFEIMANYQNDRIREVNKMFNSLGGSGEISLGTTFGAINIETTKDLTQEQLEGIRKELEKKAKEAETEDLKLTVKKGIKQ